MTKLPRRWLLLTEYLEVLGERAFREGQITLLPNGADSSFPTPKSPYQEMAELYSIARGSIATLKDMPLAQDIRLSKIFPSLSCGVPVIYSGRGEAAEFVTTHQCGVAVTPRDPASFAEAVRQLVRDSDRCLVMGRAGRTIVEKEYAWSSIVERWLNQLEPGGHEAIPRRRRTQP